MKPLKKHYDYFPAIYLPLFFVALIIVVFFPAQALLCFRVHWLALIFILIPIITPIGNIRLGEKASALSFYQWLGLLLLATLGISFLYWGFIYICFAGLPLQTPSNSQILLSQTYQTLLITFGMFPWALIILLAVGLAYVSYYLKQVGKFSWLLKSLLKNSDEDVPTLMTDFFARTMAHFSLAYAIGIICLLSIIIIANMAHVEISIGLRFVPIAVATLLIFGVNTPPWQKAVRFFTAKNIPLSVLTLLFVITTAVIVSIANTIAIQLADNFPNGNHLLIAFTIPSWQINWELLSAMWWLIWTPLMAGFIAYLSKGYRIRTVVFGGICAAILSFLIMTFVTQTNIIFNQHWRWINYILPWLGLIILMLLFMQKKYLPYQMRAVIPGTQFEKPRSTLFYTQSLFQTAAFIIILYLPLGIYVLNIFTFIMIFPWAILIAMMCVSLVKLLLIR